MKAAAAINQGNNYWVDIHPMNGTILIWFCCRNSKTTKALAQRQAPARKEWGFFLPGHADNLYLAIRFPRKSMISVLIW